MREAREILAVGLTGGIASGKTAVARILAERGCRLLGADRVVHQMLEASQPAFGEVLRRFGTRILGRDGQIDRKALAALVFEDPEERKALEGILHPLVLGEEERIHRELLGRGFAGILVTEAALVVEARTFARYDRLVVVQARPETQLRRLAAAGLPEEEARARLAAQAPAEEKAALADYTIRNDGTWEELRCRVEAVHGGLREDWGAKRQGRLSPARHERTGKS
jgi:dephospho-CoA kinase